jgi:hypothetical protein
LLNKNKQLATTSYIKYWGVWCLHETFCPAPTFVTADSDDARNPQHFIYVTVRQNTKEHTANIKTIDNKQINI